MEIKNENYIVIQGFMINKLHLKGNELLVYAIIYGFSQEDSQVYSGSLQYLANWTNSTKQGVQKNLKSLIDKGYIAKNEKFINGVKFCEYYATKLYGVCNSVAQGMQQSCTKNIEDNINIYKYIVDYLNEKTNSKYKHTTPKTKSLINARLKEGFTVEDFTKVIDTKCNEWLSDDRMKVYLRPETLFGTKFEGYLNQVSDSVSKKENHRRSF